MTKKKRSEHQIIAERFSEAELHTDRFISVRDGEKASYSHEERFSDPAQIPGDNYGIYADAKDALIIIDIDEYRSEVDKQESALQAINRLPSTLEVKTPHGGTHKFYRVVRSDELPPAKILSDRFGPKNPVPSWGEVQAANKYVVGAGSELTSCSKDWCDDCTEPNKGRYQIKADCPIAPIGAEALVQVLRADPELSDQRTTGVEPERADNNLNQSQVTTDWTRSQDSETNTATKGEWLSDELLQEALKYIDPDCGYNKWRNIGFAIADAVTSKKRAEQIFKQWSRGCPKWDDRAPDLAEDIINRAGDGRITPATIVYHAKQGGWTPPKQTKSIEQLIEEYRTDGDEELPFWLVRQAAVEFGVCSSDEFVEREADNGGMYIGFPDTETYTDTLDAIKEAGYEHNRGHHHNCRDSGNREKNTAGDDLDCPVPRQFKLRNGYYYRKDEEGNERQVTNFQLEVICRLTYEDGSREVELRVHPAQEESYYVTVQPTVFNTFQKFRDEVLEGWSTTFYGSREDLNALKEFVGTQDVNERTGVDHLGLHDDEFVLPEGSITADGWAETPKFVFTNDGSPLTQKVRLSSKAKVDNVNRESVAEIVKLLPQTRRPDRLLPILGWFYAAATCPLIRAWENEFNHLSVLGETGAGKTTTVSVFWKLFGMDDDLIPADSTGHAQLTALSSTNAIPVVFDEYKPADIDDRRINSLHNYLRIATRGGTESKGNPDHTTDSYQLRAPVCLAGEQPIRGPAEERRTIMTTVTREVTIGSTAESRALAQLIGGHAGDVYYDGYDLEQHALLFYQWLLQQDRSELKNLWRQCHGRTVAHLKQQELTLESLDDIVLQGFQTVRFGCNLYRNFADYLGIDPDETPVTEAAINEAIEYIATEGDGSEHTSHLDKLLMLCCRAAAADYLKEGEHYRIMGDSAGKQLELRLRLSTGFDQVRRYARDHDIQGEDLLETADDYRARIRDNEDRDDGYITESSITTRLENAGKIRCIGININRIRRQVSGFETAAFSDDVVSAEFSGTGLKQQEDENHNDQNQAESTTTNKNLDMAIKQFVADNEENEGTPQEEVVTAVADECDVKQDRVENRIETLLNQSRGIYQPRENILRQL